MKVKVTELAGAMPTLNRLVMAKLSTWAKAREVARLYEEIAREVDAWLAVVKKPDEMSEDEKRVLNEAEINIPEITLSEHDFLRAEDVPSPGEMFLLRNIIRFGEVANENNTREKT